MEQANALGVARQGVEIAIMVLMPILTVSLFLGLLVSVFQALTQVQEATLTFAPKLLGVAIVLAMTGNWMLGSVVNYTHACLERIGTIGVSP